MPFIVWNDIYSVNIAAIDQEHQMLVTVMNELYEAIQQGEERIVLKEILNKLVNYTITHFKTEENYFDQFTYPETEDHKKEHRDFVQKVSEFKEKFDYGDADLSYDIMKFLKDWLISHTNGVDKKYADFFHAKGLT